MGVEVFIQVWLTELSWMMYFEDYAIASFKAEICVRKLFFEMMMTGGTML